MYFASKKVYSAAPQSLSLNNERDRDRDERPREKDRERNRSRSRERRRDVKKPAPVIAAPPPPQANTNILSIDLGSLSKEVKLFTGDPTSCTACDSIFNSGSVLKPGEDGAQIWECEFCGVVNNVRLEDEEIPKGDQAVDYMLSPASDKTVSLDSKTVVFCIDVSGSMCITSEIEGKHKIRGDKLADLAKSLNENNQVDQFMPNQRRDVTYVSRLQCVQAAIESQLETLKLAHPNARVGLVVFSSEVIIIGDGTKDPIVIAGDKLNHYDTLIQIASNYRLDHPISQTKDKLVKSLYDLQESGATALGPAVVVSVGMLQNIPGSSIVLATDGLANTGVGAMDSDETLVTSTQFYEEVSLFAKQKGITINVVGIKGDRLNINNLGKLSDVTSGSVDIVDPVQITQNFASALESLLVGTNVSVKLLLHKAFKAPADGDWTQPIGDNKLFVERNIGNAYEDTEITAEFELHSEEHLAKLFTDETKKKEVPFQVQITYISVAGNKCLRVISRSREVTSNQAEAVEDVDIPLLGMHANIKTAKLTEAGDISNARQNVQKYSKLISKNINSVTEQKQYDAWNDGNTFLLESPAVLQQEQVQQLQQQQQQLPATNFAFAPQPQQSNSFFSFGAPQPQPTNNNSNSFFSFGAPPQPAQPQQQSNSIFSGFNFPWGSNQQQQQQQSSFQSPQQQYDDMTSNQIYQQKDNRKNQKQWSKQRKF